MADSFNLNRLVYFSTVVDTSSFTQAAERLGVTKTLVSQHVARLETELGTRLLTRTTRRVQPTEAGRRLYARCMTILGEAEEAAAELSQANSEPRGLLRIAAPNDFGVSVIAPLAVAFCERHPHCTVDLLLSDSRVDLVEQDIDLSIRVGWLEDSSLSARRIGSFCQIPVAIERLVRLMPSDHPTHLSELPFVANGALKDPASWTFELTDGDHERCTIKLQPRLKVSTTPAALSATLAGGGFTILPDFLIADDLASGRLVQLVPKWQLPEGGVYIVFPTLRFRPPKVTAFAAALSEQARKHCKSSVAG